MDVSDSNTFNSLFGILEIYKPYPSPGDFILSTPFSGFSGFSGEIAFSLLLIAGAFQLPFRDS